MNRGYSSLPIPSRRPLLRLTRIRFDEDDHAIAHEDIVLPLSRLPSVDADADIPDIVDAQCLGLTLGRASERVSFVPATADVARHLRIVPWTTVVKLDRVTERADGKPIEWRVALTPNPAGSE